MARGKGGKTRRTESVAASQPCATSVNPWISFLRWFSQPWAAALVALLVTLLISGAKGDFGATSRFSYYAYLSDAFLHGQLALRVMPSSTLDLVPFDGKYFLYWPPMPAILMMPFVAIWGVGVSDHMFNSVIAAANVGLMAALLNAASRRGMVDLSADRVGFLVLFFAFGTAHFVLGLLGQVWHTGQLVGLLGGLLMYWATLRFDGIAAFALAGAGVAITMLSRSSMTLIAIWPAFELLRRSWPQGVLTVAGRSLMGLAPVLLAGVGFAIYNYQRFGSPTDMGVSYHLMGESFRESYDQYGLFSVHYAPKNFYYQWLYYPLPLRADSLQGGSLLLLSPVFVAMGWAIARRSVTSWVLLATCAVGYLPILFLMGTGYLQWGPRYLMDLFPPMMLLVAIGVRSWTDGWLWVAGGISVLHYMIGVAVRV
jgi:hypothetical protein